MSEYEATDYMQIEEKNVNEEKTFSFEELNLDFAFGIYDIDASPFLVL